MKFIDYDKAIGDAFDALAEADDTTRGDLLARVAGLFHQSTMVSPQPDSDRLTGLLLELLADVDWAATGHTDRRHATATRLEPVVGAVLDRMAAEPDVKQRAQLLKELWDLVDDDTAAETIAELPYAAGMVGWRAARYLPNRRSL